MQYESSQLRRRPNRRRGMTLLELSVVAIILVAMASIAIPMVSNVADNSRISATKASFQQLQYTILNRFMPDMRGVDLSGGSSSPQLDDGLPRPGSLSMTRWISGTPPPQLRYLFVSPFTESLSASGLGANYNLMSQLGWNGPYLTPGLATYPGVEPATAAARGFDTTYGLAGDPTVIDGWGNPIVIMTSTVTNAVYLVSASSDGTLNTTPATVANFDSSPTANNDLGTRIYTY